MLGQVGETALGFKLLLRTFDIETVSYSDCARVPDLEIPAKSVICDAMQETCNIDSMAELVIRGIHTCYRFTASTAAQLLEQSWAEDFSREQGCNISALRTQLDMCDHMLNQHLMQKEHVILLILQNLCLSALVNLSTFFNMCEG